MYTVAAYRRAQEEWPWLGVMNYWFLRRPSDAERDQAWYYFRMLEPDFTPLPVYDALADLAAAVQTLAVGYHQEDHHALEYGGPWEQVADDAAVLGGHARGAEGAHVTFDYWGTDLFLVLGDSAEAAYLEATIDGRAAPTQGVSPAAPGEAPAVRVGGTLPYGRHTATLSVREGQVRLDAVIAYRRATHTGLWLGGAAAALVLVAGVVVVRTRRRHG